MKIFIKKIKRKFRNLLVIHTRNTPFYLYLYISYWHLIFSTRKKSSNCTNNYFSARPNPGAGIGHQMANWIAGYWFAKQFNLHFAHIPFSNKNWEVFLGFGENEVSFSELMKQKYKQVLLPLFNEEHSNEIELIKKIIKSYKNNKVVFITEQDQFYHDQFGVINDIKRKFYESKSRKNDKLIYSNYNFNIAIHVRRGDILTDPTNPNLAKRFVDNNYYKKVLENIIPTLDNTRPIHIYFFSQGKPEDFSDFYHFHNLHWCFDMDAKDCFLHMVYADILITGKSSFSYKPALLNSGIKICPKDFWHGYPKTNDWILAENDGTLIY